MFKSSEKIELLTNDRKYCMKVGEREEWGVKKGRMRGYYTKPAQKHTYMTLEPRH